MLDYCFISIVFLCQNITPIVSVLYCYSLNIICFCVLHPFVFLLFLFHI